MIRSRLSKKMEQKTKKNLFLSIFGIFVVIILVFKFGIPAVANLSFFLSNFQKKEEVKIQNPSFIAPPVLDSLPEATASADIIISGVASKQQSINLYINDNLINTIKSDNNGKFSFKESIKPGENIIKASIIIDGKESNFSNIIITVLKSAPPSLSVNYPTDGQSFSKDQNIVEIKGKTDTDVKVTINGLWAITDSSGDFSYSLPLQNGENKIKIIASDAAQNKTEKEIKVNYSP